MIPGAFDYAAPDSVAEAITLLQQRPGEGKIIAGGQSLLPNDETAPRAARTRR